MKLQFLKDDELEVSFQNAVKSERKIMHIVVLHVQELSRRKLYLARGYQSLFEYLVKEAKYSSSSAQRRIEAARLLTAVPEVSENLQNGNLNLSQIGDVQRAVKEAERVHQVEVTKGEKAMLVQSVLNQSQADTQAICAKLLDIPIREAEVVKTQQNKSKRIEVTFTEEQFEKYEKLKGLLASKNFKAKRTQSIADVLETVFDEVLKKFDVAENKSSEVDPSIAVAATGRSIAPTWKLPTPKRKRVMLKNDKTCQYTDPKTGRKCNSTFNLEVDHIHPLWDGGTHDPHNLRVLCRQHNNYRYRHE